MTVTTIPSAGLTLGSQVNFRNLIINGDMSIAQRGTSSVTASAGLFRIDRFQCQTNAGGIYTVEQSTDAPDNFNYSLKVTSNSAHSLSNSNVVGIWQKIEGNNIPQLNWGSASAQDVTLSFYIKSSVTGTYGVAFRSASGTTVSYLGSYTINSANTWERKTITIDGATIGTWNINNSTGIEMLFGLGVGSDYTGSAGSWSSNNYYGLTGATSLVSTNGATWLLTGVQLEVGTSASDFEFLPYDVNLTRCMRYFERISRDGNRTYAPIANGMQRLTTQSYGNVLCRVLKRASSTSISINNIILTDRKTQDKPATAIGNISTDYQGVHMDFTHDAFGADFRPVLICGHNSTGGYIDIDSEL
jgi:hypothetical protein